ncbi:Polyketide synthase enoylreductase [Penicillium hispanicum]|uniref:Polyketide synthase enoylreductase n=1 Tax=Penicillium hispanicum TaxID=1080232 RepID=UPI0025418FAF|nr:Polyketide synthase enoylreductase [Penicillium hispanicum]KAJ5584599.1 Polyketide synthase enoylreductase [Penicillium hispanicum]
MSTQKAIVITAPKIASLVADRAIPALRDDYILVKVVSVGLNPTDWQHIEFAPLGVTAGCDYAGIVEAVGKDVKKPFQKGDRICGFAHGANAVQPADGSFAEYAVVKGDVQIRIPDQMSFQEAATLGVGIHTVGQALYQSLGMALPTTPLKAPMPVLIYGGSTATGTLVIQFAKLSGYTVYTTCSPHNFDLVRGLGADVVFDYKDPQSASEIRKATNDNLKLVLDCISRPSSTEFCDNAISTEGGEYSILSPAKSERPDVNSRITIAYTVIGEAFRIADFEVPVKPEDSAHGEMFIAIAEALLAQGKIKVHPPKVGGDGLQGVLEGLQLLKAGKVSGEKLIYNVEETP